MTEEKIDQPVANAQQKDQSESTSEKVPAKVILNGVEAEVKQVTVEINSPVAAELPIKIEPTNEDEIVDIESIDSEESSSPENTAEAKELITPTPNATTSIEIAKSVAAMKIESPEPIEDDIDIEVQLRNITIKHNANKLSTSFPTQRSLWPFDNHNTIHTYTPILNRGSLNFGEMLSNNLRRDRDSAHLRHSLSTSLSRNERGATVVAVAANDTFAMLRGVSSCSKDTLFYIDHQNHRSLMDNEDNDYMSNRSLWVRENAIKQLHAQGTARAFINGIFFTSFPIPTDFPIDATQAHHCFSKELN